MDAHGRLANVMVCSLCRYRASAARDLARSCRLHLSHTSASTVNYYPRDQGTRHPARHCIAGSCYQASSGKVTSRCVMGCQLSVNADRCTSPVADFYHRVGFPTIILYSRIAGANDTHGREPFERLDRVDIPRPTFGDSYPHGCVWLGHTPSCSSRTLEDAVNFTCRVGRPWNTHAHDTLASIFDCSREHAHTELDKVLPPHLHNHHVSVVHALGVKRLTAPRHCSFALSAVPTPCRSLGIPPEAG